MVEIGLIRLNKYIMYSLDEKFNYFLKIEAQINTIIRLNYEHSLDMIIKKINNLIELQNSRTSLVLRLNLKNVDRGFFNLELYEYIRMRGYRKMFQTKIMMKSIIRDVRLNLILGK